MSGQEIASLRRQVRVMQMLCVGCLGAALIAAVRPDAQVLHVRGVVIEDAEGRPRLLMGSPAPQIEGRRSDVTTSIVIRDAAGHDRVLVGEQPDPMVGGTVMRRRAASWGLAIFNADGDERGGLINFDNGRSALALDRATGDGVGLMVDEKEDFAGFLLNYNSRKVGSYRSAAQIGTTGDRLSGELFNFDGGAAGAVKAWSGGHAVISQPEPH